MNYECNSALCIVHEMDELNLETHKCDEKAWQKSWNFLSYFLNEACLFEFLRVFRLILYEAPLQGISPVLAGSALILWGKMWWWWWWWLWRWVVMMVMWYSRETLRMCDTVVCRMLMVIKTATNYNIIISSPIRSGDLKINPPTQSTSISIGYIPLLDL